MPQRALLLSLKSKFAAAIYDGRKQYEFRRVRLKCTAPLQAFIYETLPAGAVTGTVTVAEIVHGPAERLLALMASDDPLRDEHSSYLSGARTCCALRLERPERFAPPRPLLDFLGPGVRAPQSYRFILR